MKPARILFLGNSITLHGAKPEIGWTTEWGMAASAREKDFVHVVLRKAAEAADGREPGAMIENIADFEREYATTDIAARFDRLAAFGADTIVLAIGENVPPLSTKEEQERFGAAVSALLARVSGGHKPALVVRGTFWPEPVRNAILKRVCGEAGGSFVTLDAIGADERNYARSERTLAHAGVAAHPGDAGMAAIGEAIWAAIRAC